MLNARSTCFLLGLSLVGLSAVLPASAQQSSPAAADQTTQASTATAPQDQGGAPAATPAAAPTWSIGPIDFSGAIDGYYSWNTEHPASKTNELYTFNSPTNTFSLNMAKFAMSHTADPVGFEFDLMYGDTATGIAAAGATDSFFDKNVEQAYVTFKPAKAKGFEIDFGKFVTSAGAEVVEDWTNWNYSHSLLYSWAIPVYHFGVRTSWPMGKHVTGGFQLVNGWNNDFAANSRPSTIGLVLGVTYSKWMLAENYYGGYDNEPIGGEPGSTQGWRNMFDTVFMLMPSSKFNWYFNYDYGQNRNEGESFTYTLGTSPKVLTAFPDGSLAKWQGVATALHIQATSKWAFTPRVELFDDASGAAMLGQDVATTFAPIRQTVKEFTMTGEYKLAEGLLWRAEYRYDWSNQPFFERGGGSGAQTCTGAETVTSCPQAFGLQNSKNQNTLTIAFIGYFGPKR